MTYYHWLGKDAEALENRRRDEEYFCHEVRAAWAERQRIEADGFVTIHPRLGE